MWGEQEDLYPIGDEEPLLFRGKSVMEYFGARKSVEKKKTGSILIVDSLEKKGVPFRTGDDETIMVKGHGGWVANFILVRLGKGGGEDHNPSPWKGKTQCAGMPTGVRGGPAFQREGA